MKQAREIKQFLYSQYFADGLRIAFGALLPALLFSYFGSLQIGIAVSLGALNTSIPDTPGPTSHRRNAMLITMLLLFLTTTLTMAINDHVLWLGLEILVLSFVYSMFAVYGTRAAAVGTAALLTLVLNSDHLGHAGQHLLVQSLYTAAGSVWYVLLSLSLTQFRPYRLAQQSLAVSMRHLATYLRIKADFYHTGKDAETNYRRLIEQQILVHEHQEEVRELLFRGKLSVKDTTKIGRLLILIFSDMVDLFEQSMATHYDYGAISKTFGHTPVLKEFRVIIIRLGNELDNLSYYINANQLPKPIYQFKPALERLKADIDQVEATYGLNTLALKKILINVRNIATRLDNVYQYFNLNNNQRPQNEEDLSKFISHQDFDFKIFRDNLTLNSNIFRHALRMSIMMITGYALSQLIPLGHHSYWILMTIMVILKPGFSLTKQRNYQRLAGTIIGGLGGIIILVLVKNETALFIILMVFMVCAYSFTRLNYIVSVIFMTPYILIMFSFLGLSTFTIARERVLDTLLGGFLAFISSYIVFPSWESKEVQNNMQKLLVANYQYLFQALQLVAGQNVTITAYKLARKAVYVETANMASAFQRMITEPKNKQKNTSELNKFVVFNHILSSYSVPFLLAVKQTDQQRLTGEHVKLLRQILALLSQSIRMLNPKSEWGTFKEPEIQIPEIPEDNRVGTEETKLITEQLNFLKRLAADIYKICEKFNIAQQ
ncbi:Uncharacterized membrane protein YccC [bacterium A37T11]|nr:Uncharacterized membrane protein YccC [bacterium A37T11]